MPFYFAVLPVAATNLHPNPSAERDATGWAGTVSANANRQAGTAVFGGWAMGGTPAAGANSGITGGTVQIAAAGSFTVSAYVYGGSGSVFSIGMKGTGAGAAFVGSVAGTTGGTWHRYSFSYGEAAASQRLFAVIKRSAGVDPFFVDGVQIESGTFQTTYIDGQEEGCVWTGAPHASPSTRSGTSRQGGTVVSLQSLGMTVLEHGGVGMPNVDNITQEYAIADGALWQRQRATSRVFTLTSLFSGTTWAGLHAIRSSIVDLLKIDRTPNPQPVRLLYTGAGGTSVIDAYYDGGMSMETRAGFSETTAVRLLAPDPYWYAATDEGTQLAAQVALGNTNFIVQRSPTGVWGTMGAAGVSVNTVVRSLAMNPGGTLFVGGQFTTAGGTNSGGMALWQPTGVWGTTSNGTVGANVYAIQISPLGTVFAGGAFTSAAGTTANRIAMYTGAWGTLAAGGGVNGDVNDIAVTGGTVYAVGAFTQAGGTQGTSLAFWSGAWGTIGTNAAGPFNSITPTQDGWFYIAGSFTGINNGNSAFGVARWRPGTLTSIGGVGPFGLAPSPVGLTSAVGPNGLIYFGGQFGTAGKLTGTGYGSIAAWNGASFLPLGAGVGEAASDIFVYKVIATANGDLYATGLFGTIGGIQPASYGIARWNGATWLPLDVILPQNVAYTLLRAPDGRLFVGGAFSGAGTAASVATIVNDGAANAYPVAVVRNLGTATAKVYQLLNTATDDAIYLNLALAGGETLTIDLRNNRKVVTSDMRGNLLSALMPGSNLTTWRLAPGTNTVSFFASSGSVEATLYWRSRAWSADPRL